jgi:hypothetical protein
MAGKDAPQDLCKETVEDAGLEPVWWTSESLGRTSPKKEVHMSKAGLTIPAGVQGCEAIRLLPLLYKVHPADRARQIDFSD